MTGSDAGPSAGDRVNILLVDDRPDKLMALETVLADLRQNLVFAHSGAEALRRLLQQEFALIVLDVSMPGMDGFETASLIRQRSNSELTPIIFISAINYSEVHLSRGYALGAVDYITKPFQKAELDAVIDQCLGTNQQNYAGEVEDLGDETFFVAASANMRKLRSQAALVANVDIPVLMLGESGRPAHVLAPCKSAGAACASASADQLAFELGQAAKNRKHQAASA